MNEKLRFLLLQVRNPDDPMRRQEVACFARALECEIDRIRVHDLLAGAPTRGQLDAVDMLLLGGSGHYSAAGEGPWLDRILDGLREIHRLAKPTFASCWGFQAMARALGGKVIQDMEHAELGTLRLRLTNAGLEDPIFGILGEEFSVQIGHEDCVTELPPDAVLLASTNLVENQAYRFDARPIYCTQFHPELNLTNLIERLREYPEYAEKIAGMTVDHFIQSCYETPQTEALLKRFVEHVFCS